MPRISLDEEMTFACPRCGKKTSNNNRVLGNYCSQYCMDKHNDDTYEERNDGENDDDTYEERNDGENDDEPL